MSFNCACDRRSIRHTKIEGHTCRLSHEVLVVIKDESHAADHIWSRYRHTRRFREEVELCRLRRHNKQCGSARALARAEHHQVAAGIAQLISAERYGLP